MFPIDFVVTWVDGTDQEWIKKKNRYNSSIQSDDGNNRYRDFKLLKNWFDRVWKFAPWVNNVFLITDNQAPDWAKKDKRIVVVDHSDFIPKKYIPLFNSNAIEMNIWRIDSLSEHFVYFNDDMFLTNKVVRSDFFSANGLPVLNGSLQSIIPRNEFAKIIFNNMVEVNNFSTKKNNFKKNVGKYLSFHYSARDLFGTLLSVPYSNWVGFNEDHLAYPNLKSWFRKLYGEKPFIFENTSQNRFRSSDDYSIWLLKNMYIASGNFVPRHKNFGKVISFSGLQDISILEKSIEKYSMVVINDNVLNGNIIKIIEQLQQVMRLQ